MPAKEKEKILVLCVDRDNDIGEKTSLNGPIIGRERILQSANELGLADPEDSDFNALFQTVRVFDEIKKQHEANAAVLTGDKNVGIQSDKNISKQLDNVLKKIKADYVVLVTDGVEDEHVIPIIQSKLPILSVRRVVVKQSEQLESGYYKIKDFIQESLDNPKFARLVFGLPAIILILLGVFGVEGFRVVIGILGIYLLIKGFKLEKYLESAYEELRTSFTRRRFAFFMYIVAIAFLVLASYKGYTMMLEWLNTGIFEIMASFFSASIYFYFLAGAVAWVGRGIGREKNVSKIVSVPIFGFAIAIVIHYASELILNPELPMLNFILAIVFGFALLFVALIVEWKW